ncbi:hypothetical protein [Streptomyces sp. NPDC053560]|uniref:hypothetical protein n=1 Tax=Streptomyces sp. NPDC053560 TaxID=3365711 RepID=UPI0037D9765A
MIADLNEQRLGPRQVGEEVDDGRHREDRLVPGGGQQDRCRGVVVRVQVVLGRPYPGGLPDLIVDGVAANLLNDLAELLRAPVLAEELHERLEGLEVAGAVLVERGEDVSQALVPATALIRGSLAAASRLVPAPDIDQRSGQDDRRAGLPGGEVTRDTQPRVEHRPVR